MWAYGQDGWIVRIPSGDGTLGDGVWERIVQVGSGTRVGACDDVRGRFPGRWHVGAGFQGQWEKWLGSWTYGCKWELAKLLGSQLGR